MLAVTILGNNSAIPAFNRHPTAQVVQTNEQSFLLDCGEGTQMQMERYRIRHSKINHIFISHLHGDHYFGLIGLLTSMALQNRKKELHLYAPGVLKTIIDLQLQVASAHLSYELIFHALEEECTITDTPRISIECFRMHHRIECWGFLFREKKNLRKINPEEVKRYDIPASFYEELHQGHDYITPGNQVIKNELVTLPASPPKSYAFCGDTVYYEEVIDKIRNVDMLYHETTYLHDLHERAATRFHSTSKQAATIAYKAGAKRLLVGHFSSMYEKLDDFKTEASTIFENTELAIEGMCYWV